MIQRKSPSKQLTISERELANLSLEEMNRIANGKVRYEDIVIQKKNFIMRWILGLIKKKTP